MDGRGIAHEDTEGAWRTTAMSVRRIHERRKIGNEDENEEKNENKNETRVITTGDEEMGDVIVSISSETALGILELVHESPKVSTELAKELGMTTQNVRYHLDNLEGAGLVEVGDARYSEKGRSMSVYKPAESPLVLVFGGQADGVIIREVRGR
jgi:DNA-binding transcriptional ArsR family regulator